MNKASQAFNHLMNQVANILLIKPQTIRNAFRHNTGDFNDGYLFLTIDDIIHEINKCIDNSKDNVKNQWIKSMFSSNKKYKQYISSQHLLIGGCQKALKKLKNQYKDPNDNIFIYCDPSHYRLMQDKDIPMLKKSICVYISTSCKAKGNVFLLLHSKYSSYKINSESGVNESTIVNLRNHHIKLGNISFNTGIKLSDYFESTPLSNYWESYHINFKM